jgi:hypothetical protein
MSSLTTILSAGRGAAEVAAKGIPAIRAALYGARLGAGKAIAPALERMGIKIADSVSREIVKDGARSLAIQSAEGIALEVSQTGGIAASASRSAVHAAANSTVKGALLGIGKAARQGAFAGAAVDTAFAGIDVVRGLRNGTMDRSAAAKLLGKRAVRGAVSGGAGVAAAGAASAAIAATGVSILGAPVVIPVVTMVAAGIVVQKTFDRVFGE